MSSEFLESLTSAGNAVWEYYLSPFSGDATHEPPTFPVWEAVTEVENFFVKYRDAYDWRVWLGWSSAFSNMAVSIAQASDNRTQVNDVHKFVQLVALHMGDRCDVNSVPVTHDEVSEATASTLQSLPEFLMPTWTYGSKDMDRFRFEVAAYHEWLFLQGTFIPERELSEARSDEVLDLAAELENDIFKEATLETVLGLVVLSMHMATAGMQGITTSQERAVRRVMCMQAHGMEFAVKMWIQDYYAHKLLNHLFTEFGFDPSLN